ncbi:RagB/SusD family nutrient uptake outer membrane protein [Prevotella copri]|uniref:RagB/SusD family nutrient uptake outer membrane protein n=1 Tax=Segatella copri TaxID=165179 RepID=A0AAW5U9K2_9BACT|nr:RagB/SusD family nutrient uptake outer membrane protein [Segatella copri]MCW4100330.1 RagB/SusD family nutrient uptake outer membrane protein [Segatella copri]MCW4132185.1 RagB/SusD family nutrient uptake outer membrane protein [Segatella copri]MCW4160725.1 RagB/SusD family nutrient uptake outer membrane protein [Segatella copri]
MKVLKSIYKVMGCAILAASLSSCVNDWLDVAPSDGTDADAALTSSSDLAAARTGMYAALKGNSNLVDYYGQQFFVYGDVHAGDDYQYNNLGGSNRASFYYDMNYQTASEFTSSTSSSNVAWKSPYIVIGRANRIIAAAEGGALSDAAEAKATIDQYAAEAKVLRALAHFDLVRIYGKPYTEDQGASLGVPLVTGVLESNAKPARSTVAEVYTQVVKDLTEAISSNALATETEPGYVSVWGAKAILSRVYLNMGDYANALSVAEDIIKNSGAALWTRDQYFKAWDASTPNESEFLFRLNVAGSTDNNDLNGIGNLQQRDGYKEMVATKKFVDMLTSDPKDVRNDMFLPAKAEKEVAVYGTNKVFLNKLRGQGGNLRNVTIVPIIRLSEVYLTAAECAFRNNDKTKAVEYLNDLVKNRTTTEASLATVDNITLERILIERRKELIGEGQRYFDALRNNETITRYTSEADKGWHKTLSKEAQSFNRDYFKAIAAIPQAEINANPNIKQNTGYGE